MQTAHTSAHKRRERLKLNNSLGLLRLSPVRAHFARFESETIKAETVRLRREPQIMMTEVLVHDHLVCAGHVHEKIRGAVFVVTHVTAGILRSDGLAILLYIYNHRLSSFRFQHRNHFNGVISKGCVILVTAACVHDGLRRVKPRSFQVHEAVQMMMEGIAVAHDLLTLVALPIAERSFTAAPIPEVHL